MARSLRSTLNELLSEKVADTHKMERLLSTNLAPATDLVHGGGPDRSGTMWPVPSMGLPTQELLVYKALQERVRSENASLLVNRALAAHRLGALTQQDSMLEAFMSAHMKATQMQGISFPTPQYLPHQMNYLMAEAQRRTAHPLSMAVAPRLEPSKISDEGPSKPSRATRNKMIDIMKTLGSNPRKRSDPLIDCVDFFDNADEKMAQPKLVFPERLHQLLREVEKDGLSDIVSFHPHGRSFAVHDMNRFVEEILPKWFKQSKWNSFARQLNLYGKCPTSISGLLWRMSTHRRFHFQDSLALWLVLMLEGTIMLFF